MRLAVTVLAALILVPAALGAAHAHVGLARRAPATVAGGGFRPAELVRVRLTNGTLVLSKRVRTSATGGFTVRFLRAISLPACGQLAISAIGSLGDHATWKTPPPVCGAQPPSLN